MSNSRLFEILFYLLKHRKASAATLAEQFGVSVRTIYRDIDSLSAAGIPVYSTTGRNGGVVLMEEYVLERLAVTEQERKDILQALQSLEATQFIEGGKLLEKLGILYQREQSGSIMVDFSRWGSRTSAEQEKFNAVKAAVEQQRCLEIIYVNSKGQEHNRTFEPLKLLFKEAAWYVYGFCRRQEDYRLFRLSRIVAWKTTEQTFERECNIEDYLSGAAASYPPPIHLELVADKSVKHRLYDVFDSQAIVTDTCGDVRVEADVPLDEWVYSFLLSLGPAVKYLAPLILRERLREDYQRGYEMMRRMEDDDNER